MAHLRFACINDGTDTVVTAAAADREGAERASKEQAVQTLTAQYRQALMCYAESTLETSTEDERQRKRTDAENLLQGILSHDLLALNATPSLPTAAAPPPPRGTTAADAVRWILPDWTQPHASRARPRSIDGLRFGPTHTGPVHEAVRRGRSPRQAAPPVCAEPGADGC